MGIRHSTIFYGIRYLLCGRLWTPSTDSLTSEMLDHWTEQQAVAWRLARLLAWTTVLQALCYLFKRR